MQGQRRGTILHGDFGCLGVKHVDVFLDDTGEVGRVSISLPDDNMPRNLYTTWLAQF